MNALMLLLYTHSLTPLPVWSELARAPEVVPITLFRDIAKIRRPSNREHLIRAYVRRLVREARARRWPPGAGPTITADEIKNLRIFVPATGRFKGLNRRSVALQVHGDMVETSVDGPDAVERDFKNGVTLAETEGWLHSAGHRTTIGADNGAGLALALEYAIDPTIEHPALEIFITVNEEAGMSGARTFGLPYESACLINLDWNADGEFGYACTGAALPSARGTLASALVAPGQGVLTVAVTGFPGGHSAVDIAEGRPSALVVGAGVLRELLARAPELGLLRFRSGDPNVPNAIPSDVSFTVTGSADALARAASEMTRAFEARPVAGASLAITPGLSEAGARRIDADVALRWLTLPTLLREGVIDADPLPPGWNSSSNTGVMTLDRGVATLGFMLRAFDEARGTALTEENVETLRRNWPGPVELRTHPLSSAWTADVDSFLYRAARRAHPAIAFARAGGGLEAKHFQSRAPLKPVGSLGVNILDMHTPTERVEIASVLRTREILRRFIGELGDCDELLAPEGG